MLKLLSCFGVAPPPPPPSTAQGGIEPESKVLRAWSSSIVRLPHDVVGVVEVVEEVEGDAVRGRVRVVVGKVQQRGAPWCSKRHIVRGNREPGILWQRGGRAECRREPVNAWVDTMEVLGAVVDDSIDRHKLAQLAHKPGRFHLRKCCWWWRRWVELDPAALWQPSGSLVEQLHGGIKVYSTTAWRQGERRPHVGGCPKQGDAIAWHCHVHKDAAAAL